MKLFNADKIRELDSYTILHEPISSEALMERAAGIFTDWFMGLDLPGYPLWIFAGKGNNGGDGLVFARKCLQAGSDVQVFILENGRSGSPDMESNLWKWNQVSNGRTKLISTSSDIPQIPDSVIVIDALWGSGIQRPIEGTGSKLIAAINQSEACVVSIDIPSGLHPDTCLDGPKIEADYTLSFEFPKLSFFFPENDKYLGKWSFRSIGLSGDFMLKEESPFYFFTLEDAVRLYKRRGKFSHKGSNGHTLIIAGSPDKMGASLLCAKACLTAGAGKVTASIPQSGASQMNAYCPETMIIPENDSTNVSYLSELSLFNSIVIGPGIGTSHQSVIKTEKIISLARCPVLYDADALNILAENNALFNSLRPESILTPHPGEFKRLFGDSKNSYERLDLLRAKAKASSCYIVLKGAYTAIACPDGSVIFNSSGNPALGTAGSGDVLSGIIGALIAQGYPVKEACCLGVFLHGYSADLQQMVHASGTMLAGEIIDFLPAAVAKVLELQEDL